MSISSMMKSCNDRLKEKYSDDPDVIHQGELIDELQAAEVAAAEVVEELLEESEKVAEETTEPVQEEGEIEVIKVEEVEPVEESFEATPEEVFEEVKEEMQDEAPSPAHWLYKERF